jgi:hypothetical protein
VTKLELSILIPSIPERISLLTPLLSKLNQQIGDKPVELLTFLDNRRRPLGIKRNNMMALCQGTWLTHLDDDDDVAEDYIAEILDALASRPSLDVLSFDSQADLGDNMPFTVRTSLDHDNEQTNVTQKVLPDGSTKDVREDIKRKPWHWCVWRTSIARQGCFPLKFEGEDWCWLKQVIPRCKTEVHLDKVLHFYFYRKTVSLS